MRVYEPKVEVRLVKANPRSQIVKDMPTAERYRLLKAIDLTPYLGDSGGVRTSKGVRDPAGGFTITLADKIATDDKKLPLDSLYALIEPMDLVEIRMAHDPVEYAKPFKGYEAPVLMRGFVTSVTRNEVMSSGKPVRSVQIAGQDFGKILQIIQIFYLNNSVVGDNLITEFKYFQKFGEQGEAKTRSAKEFVDGVLKNVINPYLKRITALADGRSVSAEVVNTWSASVTIDGAISPYSLTSLNNLSLHQFLSRLLDVGPFNEMYVEDLEDSVRLVVRPAPFMDVARKPVQGEEPEIKILFSKDIVSMNLSRTDGGVANYYWVQITPWALYSNEDAKRAASVGDKSSFLKFDYPNCSADYYGIRKMEISATLLPPDAAPSDSAKESEKKVESVKMGGWIEHRRKLLADINKDNVLFEYGTIRVRGDEQIKAGEYYRVFRGESEYGVFYVTKVDHEFVPFQGFYSTLTVERGTSFIDRAQVAIAPYFKETDGKGIL